MGIREAFNECTENDFQRQMEGCRNYEALRDATQAPLAVFSLPKIKELVIELGWAPAKEVNAMRSPKRLIGVLAMYSGLNAQHRRYAVEDLEKAS